ncbi:hypothetical protein DNHGIG_35840 [Collibacillus ludicampi]|uniref:CD-NTase-associated protein 12/Pycsar effector protein TIR domain-containing protein n=1 Tax=Collibacillus ludicampi TaxID=2771369 RepID=A0AAV4LJK3_9BACL|nr:nucleotide-binding protein [Collibacillus ludicampi]GIM48035.1 hypothetical protein DNHGIG_35840 [Collibacillus ludicampi]
MSEDIHVFIGSSKEQIPLVNAVHNNLSRVCFPMSWTTGVFGAMEYNLESLQKAVETCDFAVFVFHPDDLTSLRGTEVRTVRDNVIFEMGMFLQKLGRERTFFLAPEGIQFHFPTDLTGLSPLTYKYNVQQPDFSLAYLQRATNAACNVIIDAILRRGKFIHETEELKQQMNRLESVKSLAKFMDEVIRQAHFQTIDYDAILGSLIKNFNASCDIIEEKMEVQAVRLFELSEDKSKLVQIGRSGSGTHRYEEFDLSETDNTLVTYFTKQVETSYMFLNEDNDLRHFRELEYELYWPVNIQKGILAIIKLTVHSDQEIPDEKLEEIVNCLIRNNYGLFKVLREVCERRVQHAKEPRTKF